MTKQKVDAWSILLKSKKALVRTQGALNADIDVLKQHLIVENDEKVLLTMAQRLIEERAKLTELDLSRIALVKDSNIRKYVILHSNSIETLESILKTFEEDNESFWEKLEEKEFYDLLKKFIENRVLIPFSGDLLLKLKFNKYEWLDKYLINCAPLDALIRLYHMRGNQSIEVLDAIINRANHEDSKISREDCMKICAFYEKELYNKGKYKAALLKYLNVRKAECILHEIEIKGFEGQLCDELLKALKNVTRLYNMGSLMKVARKDIDVSKLLDILSKSKIRYSKENLSDIVSLTSDETKVFLQHFLDILTTKELKMLLTQIYGKRNFSKIDQEVGILVMNKLSSFMDENEALRFFESIIMKESI